MCFWEGGQLLYGIPKLLRHAIRIHLFFSQNLAWLTFLLACAGLSGNWGTRSWPRLTFSQKLSIDCFVRLCTLLSRVNIDFLSTFGTVIDCARIGEEGALGWSTWLAKVEENRQKVIQEESCHDEEGGWTGWSEPISKHKDGMISPVNEVPDVSMEHEEELVTEITEKEDDTEALLKMLGIDMRLKLVVRSRTRQLGIGGPSKSHQEIVNSGCLFMQNLQILTQTLHLGEMLANN